MANSSTGEPGAISVQVLSELGGRLPRLPQPASREFVIERDLPVRIDDGVVLFADRYAPPGNHRRPTGLVPSPYGRSGAVVVLFGTLIAERALQVIVQCLRGTFGCGDQFDPFNERENGL